MATNPDPNDAIEWAVQGAAAKAKQQQELKPHGQQEPPHPYERDDALNDRLYNVSRKVDKILHREPVENHAAILGMIQVSTQRRLHEHQQSQQREAAAAQQAAQTKARFGVQ